MFQILKRPLPVAIALLSFGCAIPSVPLLGSQEIMPLSDGNVWNYKTTTSMGNTMMAGSASIKVDAFARTGGTSEATLIFNTELKIPNSSEMDQKDVKLKAMRNDNELSIGDGNDAERINLPLETGKGWSLGSGTAKVELRENIKVPAGNFSAYRVNYTAPGKDATGAVDARWYALGVGMVKRQITAYTNGTKVDVIFELTTFTVK